MRSLVRFIFGMFAFTLLAGAVPATTRAAEQFPSVINLPNGWLPEGVITGRGPIIYSGSRANGAIYAADLRTGEGSILFAGQTGRIAVGLNYDKRTNYIFAAGGTNGNAFVYDAATGEEVGAFQLTTVRPTFINDVVVTRDAAYFTDSSQPVLYRLPLGAGGALPEADAVETIPLSGDYQQVAGFNLNGIEASQNGKTLVVVHSTLGVLYNVDPATGVAIQIDLGGASVSNGDGLRLQGKTLYVVRNRLNQIAEIKLDGKLMSGRVVNTITNPNFDVPTTIGLFGNALYAVNARFSTPPTPSTTYTIVRVER